MTEEHQSAGAGQPHMATLDRTITRACPICMAPGEFSSEPIIRDGYNSEQIASFIESTGGAQAGTLASIRLLRAGWPECYVEPSDPKRGMSVGATCPHCGAARPEPEKLASIQIER